MDTTGNAANGATDFIGLFKWKSEYDAILERIALTDIVDIDWPHLREMIKYKITNNVRQYLSEDFHDVRKTNVDKSPEQMSRSSLPPSSPSTLTPSSANVAPQGLVIPPFPKRERRKDATARVFNSLMDEKEAEKSKTQIFGQFEEFDSHPPFTIQRLCELCMDPRKHYKTVGKYLRALQRTVLVTSTKDMYPSGVGEEDSEMASSYGDNESLRLAMTPVFSPIPFLHDDARRSRSPSPFELAATKHPAGSRNDHERPSSSRYALGLVDELDDPKPGHLADRPTALTAVTSAESAPVPPLNERFVRSTSPESEEGTRDASEAADSRQAEDAEVEGMVLDDSVIEDEDKENRPSK